MLFSKHAVASLVVFSSFSGNFSNAFVVSTAAKGHPVAGTFAAPRRPSLLRQTHFLTQTRQQAITEPIPASAAAVATASANYCLATASAAAASRGNQQYQDHQQLLSKWVSHPLAAGAVAFQTQVVQPFVDKAGDVLHDALASNHLDTLLSLNSINSATTEAQVLGDLHMVLDVITLVVGSSSSPLGTMGVRAAAVLGNLLATSAQHVGGSPEQWVLQLVMLYTAFSALFQSLSHQAVGHWNTPPTPTTRDRQQQAFELFFEPVGMTWQQFTTLSVYAMEWIELEPGQTVHASSDDMHWLFKGTVKSSSTSSSLRSPGDVTSTLHAKEPMVDSLKNNMPQTNLLGDLEFLQRLDDDDYEDDDDSRHSVFQQLLNQFGHHHRHHHRGTRNSKPSQCNTDSNHESNNKTMGESSWTVVGPEGATIVRINTSATLSLLHDYDEHLEKPLRKIALQGIQSKLIGAAKAH